MNDIEIDAVKNVTPEFVEAAGVLISQLSASAQPPGMDQWIEIVACPVVIVLAARCENKVVGMVTLMLVRIPTGLRAILEDLVVLATHRQQGIGERLMRAALARARSAGARTMDFTSRPSRIVASRLYQRLGFALRDTGVYRYSFDRDA